MDHRGQEVYGMESAFLERLKGLGFVEAVLRTAEMRREVMIQGEVFAVRRLLCLKDRHY